MEKVLESRSRLTNRHRHAGHARASFALSFSLDTNNKVVDDHDDDNNEDSESADTSSQSGISSPVVCDVRVFTVLLVPSTTEENRKVGKVVGHSTQRNDRLGFDRASSVACKLIERLLERSRLRSHCEILILTVPLAL